MIYCTENHFSPFSSLLIKILKDKYKMCHKKVLGIFRNSIENKQKSHNKHRAFTKRIRYMSAGAQ